MDARERVEIVHSQLSDISASVLELGRLASAATVVELSLLRRLRHHFAPGLDTGAEADLWFSPLIVAASSVGLTLQADFGALLRVQLAASSIGSQVREVVRRAHLRHPTLFRLEEEVAWAAASAVESEAEGEIKALLDRVLATVRANPADAGNVLRWYRQAQHRLPPTATATSAAKDLQMLATLQLDRRISSSLLGRRSFPLGLTWQRLKLPTSEVAVELTTVGLRIDEPVSGISSTGLQTVSIPQTIPPVIEISWLDIWRKSQVMVIDSSPGNEVELPGYGDLVTIRTIDGRRYQIAAVKSDSISPTNLDAVLVRIADIELMDALRTEAPAGPLWLSVRGEFVMHCMRRLQDLLLDGELNQTTAAVGRPADLRQDDLEILRNDQAARTSIVEDAVVTGLEAFRRVGVRGKAWSPLKSTLKDYVEATCLMQLPDVLARWRRGRSLPELFPIERDMFADPYLVPDSTRQELQQSIVSAQLRSMLTRVREPLRSVISLRFEDNGRTLGEIAAEFGISQSDLADGLRRLRSEYSS